MGGCSQLSRWWTQDQLIVTVFIAHLNQRSLIYQVHSCSRMLSDEHKIIKSGEKTFICDWKLLHEKLHFTVVQFHLQEQQLALDSVIYWFIAGVAYLRGFSNGLFVLLSAHPLCWHSHITLTALYTSLQLETSNPASGILTFTAFSTATKQWGLLCIFKNTL